MCRQRSDSSVHLRAAAGSQLLQWTRNTNQRWVKGLGYSFGEGKRLLSRWIDYWNFRD